MKIGILYNLSDHAVMNQGIERAADAEIPFTLRAVVSVFEKKHTVIPIRFSPDIYSYLERGGVDIIFNMCEGFRDDNLGEAYVAALLQHLGIPFTGSDFFTLALCMDKRRTKEILSFYGIPTPAFRMVESAAELEGLAFSLPAIVKPLYEDASIGIRQDSVVWNRESLREKTEHVLKEFNKPVIVEQYIRGRELNVSLIGNGAEPRVLPVSEICFTLPEGYNNIVCYDAKWEKESVMYSSTSSVCPADMDEKLREKINEICKKAFHIAGCRDYARIDLRLDEKTKEPYVIEINPNPGKYVDCGFVTSARAAGLEYEDLCYTLLETTMDRNRMDTSLLGNEKTKDEHSPGISTVLSPVLIETERLYAVEVEPAHLPLLLKWFNDPHIARYMDDPEYVYNEEELHEMFFISKVHDADLIFLHKEKKVPLGFGAIYDMDYKTGSCELSLLIGDSSFLLKGLGTEIIKGLLTYAFDVFKMESVFVSVVEDNAAALGAVRNAGFKKIGARRKSHLLRGRHYNEVLFDIVKEEHNSADV